MRAAARPQESTGRRDTLVLRPGLPVCLCLSVCPPFCLCLSISVSVCVCVRMHECVRVGACEPRAQPQASLTKTYLQFETGSLTGLEPDKQARLTAQRSPRFRLSQH